MENGALALMLAPQSRLSEAWGALLLATPQIEDVRQISDASPDLADVVALEPDLIVLDVDALGEKAWQILAHVRTRAPRSRSIALVSNNETLHLAQRAGADSFLVKGFAAAKLSAAVAHLLPRSKARD